MSEYYRKPTFKCVFNVAIAIVIFLRCVFPSGESNDTNYLGDTFIEFLMMTEGYSTLAPVRP
jgi:hypothetical protein